MPPQRTNPTTRFWSKVAKSDRCWEWTGATTFGYGRFTPSKERTSVLAHRYAWEVENGPVPAHLFVCHHCDNPRCVRPSHLFLGTNKDNMADCRAKGRARNAFTDVQACKRGHTFDDANTYWYESAKGKRVRACKECARNRLRERRARARAVA